VSADCLLVPSSSTISVVVTDIEAQKAILATPGLNETLGEITKTYMNKLEKVFKKFHRELREVRKSKPKIINDADIASVNQTMTKDFEATIEQAVRDQDEYLSTLKKKTDSSASLKKQPAKLPGKGKGSSKSSSLSSQTTGPLGSAGGGAQVALGAHVAVGDVPLTTSNRSLF